jgi:DNA-binding NarL/FixJ family response regulator
MPSSTTSSETRSEAPSEPTRVLIVDDSEEVLVREVAALAQGCEVVGAVTDGPQALRAARVCQPDVIVLDISMPGMSGLEVAARLRESGSTAAVVFCTVHEDEEFIAAAKAAGGLGYVVKPRLTFDLPRAVNAARARRPFVSNISAAPPGKR